MSIIDWTLGKTRMGSVGQAARNHRTLFVDEATARREYDEYVQFGRKSKDAEVIQNNTLKHAGVLIAALFDEARSCIDLLCGDLDNDAYGVDEVIDAAARFVAERHGRLRIVLEKPIEYAQSVFLSGLRDKEVIDKVDLRVASGEAIELYKFHFLVADTRHYRFQPDRKKDDAFGKFAAPEDAAVLESAFETIHEMSHPYPIA